MDSGAGFAEIADAAPIARRRFSGHFRFRLGGCARRFAS
jgi:hypothetical protein